MFSEAGIKNDMTGPDIRRFQNDVPVPKTDEGRCVGQRPSFLAPPFAFPLVSLSSVIAGARARCGSTVCSGFIQDNSDRIGQIFHGDRFFKGITDTVCPEFNVIDFTAEC